MTITLRATPSLLAGYCGPILLYFGKRDGWRPAVVGDCSFGHGASVYDGEVNTSGGPAKPDSIRLDLAPIDGRNSPAYWHVGEMVCRAVGRDSATPLDPRGGFTLLPCWGPGERPVWELSAGGSIAYFTEKPEGTTDTEVHNLPDDPNAYPAALRAIACEVLGLEE